MGLKKAKEKKPTQIGVNRIQLDITADGFSATSTVEALDKDGQQVEPPQREEDLYSNAPTNVKAAFTTVADWQRQRATDGVLPDVVPK